MTPAFTTKLRAIISDVVLNDPDGAGYYDIEHEIIPGLKLVAEVNAVESFDSDDDGDREVLTGYNITFDSLRIISDQGTPDEMEFECQTDPDYLAFRIEIPTEDRPDSKTPSDLYDSGRDRL